MSDSEVNYNTGMSDPITIYIEAKVYCKVAISFPIN